MRDVLLVALNTRHTHSNLANACLQGYCSKLCSDLNIERIEFDLNQSVDLIINALIMKRTRILGFSTYIWNLLPVFAIAGAVKSVFPDTFVVMGGPEISWQAVQAMKTNEWIDAVVFGEGEETFHDLVHAVVSSGDLGKVKGIYYRQEDNVLFSSSRPLIDDLDDIPSPFQSGLFGKGTGFTYYETSRGCPFACAYCLSSVLGKVRNFSLARVKDDLEWFFESDYQQIRLADRSFNYDVKRAEAILEYILSHNPNGKKFHFEIQGDSLSRKIIELFAQAPQDLFHLEIGVQTTNPEALKLSNRICDLEKLVENIRTLRRETRCHIHLDLLGGLPGDTQRDFKKSLDDACSWKPHTIQIGMVKVLKGTALENFVKSKEVICEPRPVYRVLKTTWLEPENAVLQQDTGKMVETFFNSHRYDAAIEFLVKNLFNGMASEFYEKLALFWRQSERQFFGLSPENMANALLEFVRLKTLNSKFHNAFRVLIEHEFRLTQKVPADILPLTPSEGKVSGALKHVHKTHIELSGDCKALECAISAKWSNYKVVSGVRVFWYVIDPCMIAGNHPWKSLLEGSFPMVYRYNRILSGSKNTENVDLSLIHRLVIGHMFEGTRCEMIPDALAAYHDEVFNFHQLDEVLQLLLEKNLVYNPVAEHNHHVDKKR